MESDPLALDNSNIKEEPGIIDEFEPENKKIKLNLDIQNPDIEQDDTVTIKTEVLDDNFGFTNPEFEFVDPNVEIKNEGSLWRIDPARTWSEGQIDKNGCIQSQKNFLLGNELDTTSEKVVASTKKRKKQFEPRLDVAKMETQYPCEHCALTFKTPDALDFHLYRIHKCRMCGKIFPDIMGLMNHVAHDRHSFDAKWNTHSPKNGQYSKQHVWPEKKIDESISKANLSWSLSLAPDPEVLQSQRKHKCDKCGAAYKLKGSLKTHMKKCGLPKNFKCQLCDCAYFEQKCLDKHFKDIHDSHHPCEYCTLVFKTPEALEFHLHSTKCRFINVKLA